MKCFYSLVLFFLIVSCSEEKKINDLLNKTNLASTLVTIKASADTTVMLPKGGILKIEKGTFEKDVELEIREAYSMNDIALAGLVTESNGEPLQSGGMIYVNTKNGESVGLNKPLAISIPTSRYVPGMKLFKGEEKEGGVNWIESGDLKQTIDDCITRGRYLFRRNCSSCHGMKRVLSGPALAGVSGRGPWKDRSNIYKWVHNPSAFMSTNSYTRNLQKQYGQLMPSFKLEDSSINCIVSFIENETKKSPKDPTSFDRQPGPKQIRLGKDTLIYAWPDGKDTIIFKPDTDFLADTSTNDNPVIDDYYEFHIEALGWYNIDALLKQLPGIVDCQLSVNTQPSNDSVTFSCYLLLPGRKIMIDGYGTGNGHFTFYETDNDHIPLYLNDRAMILVVGVSPGKNVFYGFRNFKTAKKQVIPVNIKGPVNKQEFNQVLISQKLDDIGFAINE